MKSQSTPVRRDLDKKREMGTVLEPGGAAPTAPVPPRVTVGGDWAQLSRTTQLAASRAVLMEVLRLETFPDQRVGTRAKGVLAGLMSELPRTASSGQCAGRHTGDPGSQKPCRGLGHAEAARLWLWLADSPHELL